MPGAHLWALCAQCVQDMVGHDELVAGTCDLQGHLVVRLERFCAPAFLAARPRVSMAVHWAGFWSNGGVQEEAYYVSPEPSTTPNGTDVAAAG
eukprot:7929727-Lingulodinium_polyedra.AAC.1